MRLKPAKFAATTKRRIYESGRPKRKYASTSVGVEGTFDLEFIPFDTRMEFLCVPFLNLDECAFCWHVSINVLVALYVVFFFEFWFQPFHGWFSCITIKNENDLYFC